MHLISLRKWSERHGFFSNLIQIFDRAINFLFFTFLMGIHLALSPRKRKIERPICGDRWFQLWTPISVRFCLLYLGLRALNVRGNRCLRALGCAYTKSTWIDENISHCHQIWIRGRCIQRVFDCIFFLSKLSEKWLFRFQITHFVYFVLSGFIFRRIRYVFK